MWNLNFVKKDKSDEWMEQYTQFSFKAQLSFCANTLNSHFVWRAQKRWYFIYNYMRFNETTFLHVFSGSTASGENPGLSCPR